MAARRQDPLARLRRALPARRRRRPGRDPDRDADLPRGARRATIRLAVRDGTFQLGDITGRITMRIIAATLAILSIAACGQPDITRERGYIARCTALGIRPGSEQFQQCRLWLESLDLPLQAEAQRGS